MSFWHIHYGGRGLVHWSFRCVNRWGLIARHTDELLRTRRRTSGVNVESPLPSLCLTFASSSFGRRYATSRPDWTRPVLTLPNNWHVCTGWCRVGSWVKYHGKLHRPDWAQLSQGTCRRAISWHVQKCDTSPLSPNCKLQSHEFNQELLAPSLCSVLSKQKRLTTSTLATTQCCIVLCNPSPLLLRSLRWGGDSLLTGWQPDRRFFGQCKRRQMPSPPSSQRRGVKVFTGTPSRGFWVESGQWCSKGRFGTVQYSIWHLSTADATLKAVSLLLWSVFLTPAADKRIHPLCLLLKFLLSFPLWGFWIFFSSDPYALRVEGIYQWRSFGQLLFASLVYTNEIWLIDCFSAITILVPLPKWCFQNLIYLHNWSW